MGGDKKEVLRFANSFTYIKEIGWDIAITPTGVVAIEMNLGFGLEHLQITCGGLRRHLNIYPRNK